ncbi:MAG: ATP synthase F1 subunit gamma [Planctomycetes bacterium]|nr:ATP synthase F1 subunit gamma [Planctomycetota bacterium]
MPSSREIRTRIKSVKNTGKITKTMGMVAAAKSVKGMKLVKESRPYVGKIRAVLASVLGEGDLSHPLFMPGNEAGRKVLLVMTANRGLCGGYNSNIVRLAKSEVDDRTDVIMMGKKGAAAFRFAKLEMKQVIQDSPDLPGFESGTSLIDSLMEDFLSGRVASVRVVYTCFVSAGQQSPVVEQLLPLKFEGGQENQSSAGVDSIYEPNRESLLATLVPKVVRVSFFKMLLDAAVSEHLARQMSMKSASENADEMNRVLSLKYNRARQAQITTEISEIVSGAEALN